MGLSTTATPREDLTMIVTAHAESQQQFVLPRVLPIKEAQKKAGRYFKVKPGTNMRAPNAKRASTAKYMRDTFDMEDDTFACETKGLEGLAGEDQILEFDDVMPLEQALAVQKVNQILRSEEVELATSLFNRTTFPIAAASGHDPTNEWDDHANATPVDDVHLAIEAIENNLGDFRALGLQICALMSRSRARHAGLCAQVRSGLGGIYTRPEFAAAEIPLEMLASALNVDEVIVPNSRQQTGGTPAAPTASKIFSDEYCLIFVRANPDAPVVEGLGLTFVWTKFGGEYNVSTYDEEDSSSRVVQVDRASQQKIINAGAGYLIGNLVS